MQPVQNNQASTINMSAEKVSSLFLIIDAIFKGTKVTPTTAEENKLVRGLQDEAIRKVLEHRSMKLSKEIDEKVKNLR